MTLKTWYPFYVGDYQRDTAKLSMIEHGAYRLLLDEYYATGLPLPDDEKQLFRVCRAFDEEERDAIRKVLKLFFLHDEKNGIYIHEKCKKELQKRTDISKKRRQAIEKRWKSEKYKSNTNVSTKSIPSTSTSTSTSTDYNTPLNPPQGDDVISQAVQIYNDTAEECNLPKVQKLSETRRKALRKRLEDCGGLEGWKGALEKVRSSQFLTGNNDRGWKADLDFIVKESKFIKLMEGGYQNEQPKQQSDRNLAALQRWVESG